MPKIDNADLLDSLRGRISELNAEQLQAMELAVFLPMSREEEAVYVERGERLSQLRRELISLLAISPRPRL